VARRLKQGHGLRRIRWELRAKGIAGDLLDSAIAGAAEGPSGAGRLEEDQALALARRRLARHGSLSPLERTRRVAGFLERRGFSAATIARVLRALGAADTVEQMNG
jgi:SOS response regulatory protein OraA/RecX